MCVREPVGEQHGLPATLAARQRGSARFLQEIPGLNGLNPKTRVLQQPLASFCRETPNVLSQRRVAIVLDVYVCLMDHTQRARQAPQG